MAHSLFPQSPGKPESKPPPTFSQPGPAFSYPPWGSWRTNEAVEHQHSRRLLSKNHKLLSGTSILLMSEVAVPGLCDHSSPVRRYLTPLSRSCVASGSPWLTLTGIAINLNYKFIAGRALTNGMVLLSSICFVKSFLVDVYLSTALFHSFSSIWGSRLLNIAFQNVVTFLIYGCLTRRSEGYKLSQNNHLHPGKSLSYSRHFPNYFRREHRACKFY